MSKTEKELIADKVAQYSAIDVISKMEGGKAIINSLQKDLVNYIDKIAYNYETATHAELISMCASIRSTIAMMRLFKNAEDNKKLLQEEFDNLFGKDTETES